MGVWIVNAAALKPTASGFLPQEVVGVVDPVPALQQHGAAIPLTDGPCRRLHLHRGGNGKAAQKLCLRNVGCNDLGQRQKLTFQRIHGILPQQPVTGGGDHHRVHHHTLCSVLPQLRGDYLNQLRRGDHAGLHRVGGDIGEDRVQLRL
ncbi:hypothetical protein SDC9_78024 [bioreactor metagenome]|uniref:Uncharacterized protein n=1 Tax=bioreactor metagenome TaxID=1076179 RepID=A0A644YT20_9ZZZZ